MDGDYRGGGRGGGYRGRGDYRGGGRAGAGGAFRGRGRGRGRGGGDGDDQMADEGGRGGYHHRERFDPYDRGRGRGGGRGRGRGGVTLPVTGPYTIQIAGYHPLTKQQELEEFLVEKCTVELLDPAPGPFSETKYSLRLNLVIPLSPSRPLSPVPSLNSHSLSTHTHQHTCMSAEYPLGGNPPLPPPFPPSFTHTLSPLSCSLSNQRQRRSSAYLESVIGARN
jgi:hypothetical protein